MAATISPSVGPGLEKRDGQRLDHGDGQAASAAGGGDLETDESRAHDRDTWCVHQCPPQHERVVQTAQDEQPARGAMPGGSGRARPSR
jgi:hypothetical protein